MPRKAPRPAGTTEVRGGYGVYPIGFGGAAYGGYYGGYFDPWYGGYDPYVPPPTRGDEGAIKLKITPKEALVYVDGYFAGVVDDFDGLFQRLHVESGPHHFDVQAVGYEPLSFDVQITPDHTITYRADLRKIQ